MRCASISYDPEDMYGENYDQIPMDEYEEIAYGTLATVYPEVSEEDIGIMVEHYLDNYANDNYHVIDDWDWSNGYKEEFYKEATGKELGTNNEEN